MEFIKNLINKKNIILNEIFNNYLNTEEKQNDFFENKSFLIPLLEISSISIRYIINTKEQNKLKKLLSKNILIVLIYLEMFFSYSKMFKLTNLPYKEYDYYDYYDEEIFNLLKLENPTIYSPFLINDPNINNIINTIGVMSCNTAIGNWNEFETNNYKLNNIINKLNLLKETDSNYCLFLLKFEFYLLSFLDKLSEDELKEILPSVFFIKKENENKITTQNQFKENEINLIEQPDNNIQQIDKNDNIKKETNIKINEIEIDKNKNKNNVTTYKL